MHETAITEALILQVASYLPEGGKLVSVRIEIGQLEHLDPDVMRTTWELGTEGTELSGAGLDIVRTALRVECTACGLVHEPSDPAILVCPQCDAVRPRVIEGSGIRLMALDVDLPTPHEEN